MIFTKKSFFTHAERIAQIKHNARRLGGREPFSFYCVIEKLRLGVLDNRVLRNPNENIFLKHCVPTKGSLQISHLLLKLLNSGSFLNKIERVTVKIIKK